MTNAINEAGQKSKGAKLNVIDAPDKINNKNINTDFINYWFDARAIAIVVTAIRHREFLIK